MSSDTSPIVLAFSGGLDTTTIVVWLKQRGYEVHAVLVDVGQQEDLTGHVEKALRLGAKSAVICDAQPAMLETPLWAWVSMDRKATANMIQAKVRALMGNRAIR